MTIPPRLQEGDRASMDIAGITAALHRAARRAHEIARDTGTKVIVARDGKLARMDPDPEMFDDLIPPAAAPRRHGARSVPVNPDKSSQ